MKRDRTHELYLGNEATFFEDCLKLLKIEYIRHNNVVSEDTGLTCDRLTYESDTDEEQAIIHMFAIAKKRGIL